MMEDSSDLTSDYMGYEPPITPNSFPHLSLLLLLTGLITMGWFFTLIVTTSRNQSIDSIGSKSTKLVKELFVSFLGSIFFGFGTLFLLLSVGLFI